MDPARSLCPLCGYRGKIKRLTSIDKGQISFREAVAAGKSFAQAWHHLGLPASQRRVVDAIVMSGGEADLDYLVGLYPLLPTRAERSAKLRQAIFHVRRRLTHTGFTVALAEHRRGYRIEPVAEENE